MGAESAFYGAPAPGDVFAEKYVVEHVLGAGGTGIVFAARHVHLHERVAIKRLLPTANEDPEIVERFLREGRAAVRIKSDHVARVLDVGKLDDGSPYLVMEHLEGEDLAETLVRQRKLKPEIAIDYVLQACEAIAEAHSLGIVHRDLKPGNLFAVQRPEGVHIKVLDFGISKMAGPDGMATQTKKLMGSPLYMSPEQLRSARFADPRSDIWSIGVVLYELMAGLPPFRARSLPQLSSLIREGTAPPWLPEEAPHVTPEIARVVATCLRIDPAKRYATISDFANAIAPYGSAGARASAAKIATTLGGGPAPSSGVQAVAPAPLAPVAAEPVPSRSSGKARIIVVVCLTLAVVGLILIGIVAVKRHRAVDTSSAAP